MSPSSSRPKNKRGKKPAWKQVASRTWKLLIFSQNLAIWANWNQVPSPQHDSPTYTLVLLLLVFQQKLTFLSCHTVSLRWSDHHRYTLFVNWKLSGCLWWRKSKHAHRRTRSHNWLITYELNYYKKSISCWYWIINNPPTHFLPMFRKFARSTGPCIMIAGYASLHFTQLSVFWTRFIKRVGACVLEHSVMALPLCFVPSYLNVLERILLDGDFHDFSSCSKHVHYLFQVKSGTSITRCWQQCDSGSFRNRAISYIHEMTLFTTAGSVPVSGQGTSLPVQGPVFVTRNILTESSAHLVSPTHSTPYSFLKPLK
jgi:hypothetical protein